MRHLRVVDTETGEVHEEGDCAKCADQRAETEIWEQRVLKLEREVKRLTEDRDLKAMQDKNYPAAADLFDEWKRECGHPNAKFDPARVRLALGVIKRYKNERDKLSLVIGHGKHLAYVDPNTRVKYDEFGRLFGSSDEIEKRATAFYLWQKRNPS